MTDQPITPADEQVPVAYRYAHKDSSARPLICISLPAFVRARPQDWIVEPLFTHTRPAPETTASDDVVEVCKTCEQPVGDEHERWCIHRARGEFVTFGQAALANLPKPTEQATSPAPDAVLREALMEARRFVVTPNYAESVRREMLARIDAALASSKPTGCEGERERCARIAESLLPLEPTGPWGEGFMSARKNIAAAIRSGDKAEGEAS